MTVDFVNSFIAAVGAVLGWILDLFPDSPFSEPVLPEGSGVNLGWVTWLLDFPTWIQHLSLLLGAIVAYYGIRVLARWVKVVRS